MFWLLGHPWLSIAFRLPVSSVWSHAEQCLWHTGMKRSVGVSQHSWVLVEKIPCLGMTVPSVVAHVFTEVFDKQRQRISVSWRPAWSTERAPHHPVLHRKTLKKRSSLVFLAHSCLCLTWITYVTCENYKNCIGSYLDLFERKSSISG